MNKKVAIPPKPTTAIPLNADDWVNQGPSDTAAQGKPVEPESANESADAGTTQEAPAKQEKEPMKRFTFDVPASLHRRVKKGCVDREIQMADLIREFLEKEFPA